MTPALRMLKGGVSMAIDQYTPEDINSPLTRFLLSVSQHESLRELLAQHPGIISFGMQECPSTN